jgi:hypothetical protein
MADEVGSPKLSLGPLQLTGDSWGGGMGHGGLAPGLTGVWEAVERRRNGGEGEGGGPLGAGLLEVRREGKGDEW